VAGCLVAAVLGLCIVGAVAKRLDEQGVFDGGY
jgi:hypothetical protein